MSLSIYKNLPAKSFSTWFTELAALAKKANDSSILPRLELWLKNGHQFKGVIIRIDQNNHEQVLMLLSTEGGEKVSFVCGNEVAAVTILDPDKFIKHFAPPTLSNEVSSLELKRRTKATEQAIEEATFTHIPLAINEEGLNEHNRNVIALILDLLTEVFKDVSSDEFGKKAINESIKTIEILESETPQISLKEGKLSIGVTSPLKRPVSEEKEYLKTEIETLL